MRRKDIKGGVDGLQLPQCTRLNFFPELGKCIEMQNLDIYIVNAAGNEETGAGQAGKREGGEDGIE
jgi:hypothetical protein